MMVFSAFRDLGVLKKVKEGTWRQDPEIRHELLEQLGARQGPVMEYLLGQVREDPGDRDTANQRATAMRTLADMGEMGADWAFAPGYLDEELLEQIRAAARFEPKALKFDRPDLKAAAGALLAEVEARRGGGTYIPTILAVLRDPKLDEVRKRTVYRRLEKLLASPEVVALLVDMSKGPLHIRNTISPSPKVVDGMGAYALAYLLGNEVEAALPAVLENRLADLTAYNAQADHLAPVPVGREYFIEFVKPGSTMADLLLHELHSENVARQAFAMDVLSQIDDRRAVEPLLAKLRQPAGQPLPAVLATLAQFEEGDAIPAILPLLVHGERGVRNAARAALDSLRPAWSREAFTAALGSGEVELRAFAAQALGELGDPAARADLERLVEDPERAVRKAAQKALKHLG